MGRRVLEAGVVEAVLYPVSSLNRHGVWEVWACIQRFFLFIPISMLIVLHTPRHIPEQYERKPHHGLTMRASPQISTSPSHEIHLGATPVTLTCLTCYAI